MPVAQGNSLKFSRWASRLTIRAMLLPRSIPWEQLALDVHGAPPAERGHGWGVPWQVPKWIYLSTLTFADPEPSYSEGRRRQNSFRTWLERNGKWAVCAPEYGEETGRLHFHLAHVDRWDAAEMWRVLPRYGFGRYDVRKRPAWRVPPSAGHPGELHPAAWYLAKYVGKRVGWPEELKGCRQWSVIGEKLWPHPVCKVRDVRIRTTSLTIVAEQPQPFLDWREWRFPNHNLAIRVAVRADATPRGPSQMREITPEQQKKIFNLLATGDIVGVGEYRFCGVEQKDMEQWKDGKRTGNRESRVIVTHKVDFGVACERREFDDLLPIGADPKTVTPPAKSGDMVAVCIDGMRAFQGGTNYKGRVVKL